MSKSIGDFNPGRIITSVLRPLGFKRDGNYWVKELPHYYYCLSIYKGDCGGPDSYLETRVTFKALTPPGKTFKTKCHHLFRLHEKLDLNGALTYLHEYKELSDDERRSRLLRALSEVILPKFERYEDLNLLKNESMGPEARKLVTELCERETSA